MQKGNSTGKLTAGENVSKLANFYQSLSTSNLKLGENNVEPEKPDPKLDVKPDKSNPKPSVPNKPDKLDFKQKQASNQICTTPPKPAVLPKPCFAKDGESLIRSNSQDSSPPRIAPKPKRGPSPSSINKIDHEENGHEENGYQNGHEEQQQEEEPHNEEQTEEEMDNGNIEEAEGIDEEEDDDGWDSDEFESENDSDDRDDSLPDKRASRIIFDELDHIPDLDFLDPRKKKLFNIAKEILTTEVTYVKTLKLLDEVFHFRLDNECRAKGIVPKEAMLEIFSNIPMINHFHRDFLLPKLEERMKNWDTQPKVGDIFNSLAPFLKMYAEYVKNFDQAMNSLSKWKLKSQKFAAMIEQIQKTEPDCNNLTLEHHMLAPVQRVPRYKLLLTDYISKLPENSPDLEESKKSLEIISAAANHANESMKKTERFQKMLEMQDKFGDSVSIVTPSREFIMEDELIKLSSRNSQIMTRILVLFNDSLYYCTKVAATGKYKVHQSNDLLSTYLREPEEETENRELVFRIRSKNKAADFQATSVEQKEKWVSTLTEAIKNAMDKNSTFGREVTLDENELGRIAPIWIRDENVSMCMTCTTVFTALRRRHHCRACGKIFCSNCSSYKAPLEYDGSKMNRVCVNCHKILTNGEVAAKENKKEKGRKKAKVHKIADSVLSGCLNFRSESTKAWTKRWCVLGDDFTLHVFRAKKDVKAQKTIPLPGCELQNEKCDESEKNGKHVFKVSHKGIGSFMFETDNDETLEKWSEYIKCAIQAEPYPERSSTTSTPPPSPK